MKQPSATDAAAGGARTRAHEMAGVPPARDDLAGVTAAAEPGPAAAHGRGLPAGAEIFEIRGMTFRYGTAFQLEIDQFTLGSGEKVALVGANGSGKTTLLRLLTFLEKPHGWQRFRFRGRDHTPGRVRRDGLAFLKQQPYLFRGSVEQNLAYPLRLRGLQREILRKRVAETLEWIDLTARARTSACALSGGEQKRLALGRVLIADPEILLLDEPMAHLDRRSRTVIERILEGWKATLLFTTHDLRTALRLADRVLHLQDGRVTSGLPENVLAGRLLEDRLVTSGGLTLFLAEPPPQRRVKVALDPRHLVLSLAPLASSMRNQFRGRIVSVHDHGEVVWLDVDCGEVLTVFVTRDSYERMDLNLNREVFVSCKAQAVEVL